MLNRSKLWATGLLVAMFVTGAAVGGGMSQAWGGNSGNADNEGQDSTNSDRPSYVERLAAHLDLTESQQAAVESILARRESDMAELWQGVRPKFDGGRTESINRRPRLRPTSLTLLLQTTLRLQGG